MAELDYAFHIMNTSVSTFGPDSEDAPSRFAAYRGPIVEGQGRRSEASRQSTRGAALRMLPWLILAFWTVLTLTVFR